MSDYTHTKERDNFIGFNRFINTPAYKIMRVKYLSLTYTLNTSSSLVNKGQQLLPRLFEHFKHSHQERKLLLISALLYFIYQNENAHISIRKFQDRLFISNSAKFLKALQDVKHLFKFSNHSREDLIETNVYGNIRILCKVVLNPKLMDDISLENLEVLAQRLAKAIQHKSWFDSLKISTLSKIEYISVTSTILSAHYHLSLLTNRKLRNSDKKLCFRYSTINFDKIEEHTNITYRTIAKWNSSIQKKLFDVIKLMPIKPGFVKNFKEVGRVLVEILDFLDLQIESVFEENKFQVIEKQFKIRKEFIINTLNQFLGNLKKLSTKVFPWLKFVDFLKKESKKSEDLKDSEIELKKKVKCISMDGHEIHMEHVEIIFELFTNGATLSELKDEKLSNLVKKYIENQSISDSELTDIDDDDIDQYIRTPLEIKTIDLAIVNQSD